MRCGTTVSRAIGKWDGDVENGEGQRRRKTGGQSAGQPRLAPCGSFSTEYRSFEMIAEDDLAVLLK